MLRPSKAVLARLRNLFEIGLTGRTFRSRLRRPFNQIAVPGEVLEARQLLVMPPGQPTVDISQSPITIQWVHPAQDPDPAVSYDLVIKRTDLVSGGLQTVINEPGRLRTVPIRQDEIYPVTEPLAPGTYSVFIAARSAGNVLSPTVSTSFGIEQLAPEILTISGQQISLQTASRPILDRVLNLSWTAIPGVNDYYVWIDKKATTGWIQISDTAPRAVKGNVLEHDLPVGQYRARVRSLNQPTAWSQPVEFEVTGNETSSPEITSSSAAVSSGGALTWTREKNAVRYELEIVQAGSATVARATVHGPEYRGEFLPIGDFSARVRSINAAGIASDWSISRAFRISNATYKPVISSGPVNIQINGVEDLKWSPITWASGYEVTVTRIDGTTGLVRLKERLTEPRFSFPKLLAGTYTATVKAFDRSNASGPDQASNSESFVVTATTYQPAVPVLAQTGTGQRVEWDRVAGAVRYEVVVCRLNNDLTTVHSTILRQPTQNEFFPLDHRFVENLTYRVNIRPVLANGEVGPYSENFNFLVSARPQISVRISASSDARRPRLEWTDLPSATSYRLRIFNTNTSVVPLVDKSGLTVPYFQLEASLAAGSYMASVEAILPGEITATGSISNFLVPPPVDSAISGIRVSFEEQRTVIRWISAASGLYDIRLAKIEQPDQDVVREQTYSAANSTAERTYALLSDYNPGLYRVDVGQRLPATNSVAWKQGPVFYFTGSNINPLQANGVRSAVAAANLTGPFRGDFNGDNRADLLIRSSLNGQMQVYANGSTELETEAWSAFSTQPTNFVNTGASSSILVGDFNGDGRDDLLQPDMDSSTWAVMRSTTQNTFEKVLTPVSGLLNPDLPTFSWNAQSRLLSWKPVSAVVSLSRRYELKVVRNGLGNVPATVVQDFNLTADDNSATPLTVSLTSLATGQYTIFARTQVEGRVSQWSEGFSISVPVPNSPVGTSDWSGYFVGDFNGDRRDDIAAFNSVRQQWVVSLSNGTSFERSVWSSSVNSGGNGFPTAIADVNGDGRKDLVYRNGNSTEWTVGISTGTSFLIESWSVPAFLNNATAATTIQVADMNADGRDDLIAPVSGGFQVAMAGSGTFEAAPAGTAWEAVLMPTNSVAVDINDDRRADLVGFDGSDNSIVALSTASGFTAPAVWQVDSLRPWFKRLWQSGVSVVDYQYRTREVENAFRSIRNNIEYEGYRGLKKGADGTLASRSGNAWDQANLLGTQITEEPWTKVRYVTGRMQLTRAQVNSWLTTTVASASYFAQAGLNGADVSGNIEFDHAWLQAWLPTATGLNWVDLNPSYKTSSSAAPENISAPFLTDDLKAYLSPVTRSFSADFDLGSQLTGHDTATLPTQLLFHSGSGRVITENTWPKLDTANGLVDDYKLVTDHASPTNILVGQTAVNGTFSANIAAQEVVAGTVQDFRVFARSTEDYEIGFIWPQGEPNAPYTQRLYERIGDTVTYLNATLDTTAAGAPAFKRMVPLASDASRTAAGLMQCQVDLSIENNSLTVFVQWENGDVVSRLKLTSTSALRMNSGRFGIYTAGSGHHYLDNIKVEARDISSSSPLEWTINRKLGNASPAVSESVVGIGHTRTILESAPNQIPGSLTPVGLPMAAWNASEYQTIAISFVRPDGSTATHDSLSGIVPTLPQRLSDIARSSIVVRTASDGKSASLLLDNVTYIKTIPFTGSGTLRLRVELRTSPTATAETQILPLQPDSYSQVLLRAGQYSAADVADAANNLSESYAYIPLTAITSQGVINTAVYNPQQILEKVVSYSAIRLLSRSEQSEDDIARMTQAILMRPGVTAGLITARSSTVQPDSIFFIRPKNIAVDFPVGKLLYVPRTTGVLDQADPLQQSRARLTLAELSAREQDLLSEISDNSALSAMDVLSLTNTNGTVVRRLRRNIDGTYSDTWNSAVPASTSLSSFLSFGTSPNQVSAFNQIQQQLNAGGIVTVASTMQSLNGWTGFAWLHERYSTNTSGTISLQYPIIESLMLSNEDGLLLHGGVVSNSGAAESSDFSQLRDTGVTPDLYQGIMRRSDTDFSIRIPGMTLPFSRTWASSRSDASTTTRIMDGTDLSGFGDGWMHPFAQQLDVTTMTPTTVYYVKKGNRFTGHYNIAVQNNTDRVGEPASIVWHREDGSSGVFSPNGKGGTTTVNATLVKTAEYENSFNMPGIVVRRIDGPTTGVYGDFYEIIHADGATYRFQDFNSTAVRQTGKTTAYLVSISDRFGNSIAINRDVTNRSRITSITNSTNQRILASFTYTNSRISRIVVPAASTGNAPAAGFTGMRVWDYFYDAENRLNRVKVSEATGTDPALHATSTVARFAYSWYDKLVSSTDARRGDRLEGLMKSATGFSGTSNETGDSSKTLYEYYSNGRLRSIHDADDRVTTFLYHSHENLTSTVDTSGALTTTQFSDLGDMVMSTRPSGERILYEMAPNVRQTSRTMSTSGRSESWAYDDKGNVIEHRDAAGITQLMTYHPVYNQVASIREKSTDGVERQIAFNEYFDTTSAVQKSVRGALFRSTDALLRATQFRYSPQGLVAEIISPRGHKTVFDAAGYDAFGNPVRVDYQKLANGIYTTLDCSTSVFDNTGQLDQVLEYNSAGVRNRITDYTWDALGRLIETSTPDPYITSKRLRTLYFYNSLGLQDRRIDPDGSVWRNEYDSTGRLLREIRPDGTFSEIQYNANGTIAASIDPNGNTTRFVYDVLNRPIQTIFPDGTTTTQVYDARGDLEQEIDQRGNITSYDYDSAGRLLNTVDSQNQQTTYAYDTFGNQISIATAKGIITNLFNANRQIIQTLYESKQIINGVVLLQKARVDQFFYDANGNQQRAETIDLRPDANLMPPGLIASLTDSLVTTTETGSVDQSRIRITTTAFDFRDRAISSTNAANGTSSKVYSFGLQVASSRNARGAQTSFFYDLAGQLQFEALPTAYTGDSTGLARVYRRDSLGRVIETRETSYTKDGASTLVQRESNGEPVSAAGSDSARVTRTSYDNLGQVIATQDAMGFMTRVTYDPAGNIIETIDASRRSRFKVLDKMNRVVREVLPPVLVAAPSVAVDSTLTVVTPTTFTEYDASGNVVAVTEAAGQTTTFLYDSLNRRIQKTAPAILRDLNGVQLVANPVWKWTFDALGNVTSEIDPANRTTTYTYDLFGRVLSKTLPDPDGSGVLTAAVTEFTYDAFGNLLTQLEKGSLSVEGDERLTTHEYNALNLRTRTTLPDPDGTFGTATSPVLSWAYDANGNLLAETNPLGRITRYTWNLKDQLTKTDLPAVSTLPAATVTSYDLFGNITSTTDALGRTTRFDHDAVGRVILTIMPHPDGVAWSGLRSFSTATDYDTNGNVIRVTDHMDRVSTSAYDSLNRLIRSTKPDPYSDDIETAPVESISYDVNGNVARKTDALGRITRFEHDALNRPILTAVQDGAVWAETETRYDLAGNATRIIDPLERVTVYTFNNWNLLTRVRLPSPTSDPNAGPATSTAYDQWGNVLTVTSPRSGVTQNEYDRLNRLTRRLLPSPGANMTRPETSFEYDAAGNVVLQSVLMNRIGTSEVWTETETTYDELNRVIRTAVRESQVPANSSPSPATITSTTYDKVGNVLSITRHGETTAQNRTTSFQYDRLNRKVTEIAPAPSSTSGSPVTRYRYDLAGNLEATIDPLGRITSNTYDALGRLCTTTSPDPDGLQGPLPALISTFRYDVVGNLLSTTDHLGRTTTSTFDSRNRVVAITQPDADLADYFLAPVTRYSYDLVGNRIQETDALGNTTDFVYDNLNRLTSTILPDALINDRLARPMTTFTYDLDGNLTSSTDAAGRTSLYYYDLLNRKYQERTTDPDGAAIGNFPLIMIYSYDAVGNLLTSNSYRSATVGRITRHEYDYLNHLIRTTTPPPANSEAQSVTLYGYDIFGNQISVTQTSTALDAVQKTTVYVFDNLNRLTETRSPDPVTGVVASGPVSTTTYDLAGRVLTERDPLGRVTTFYYDDLDRKIRVVGHDPDASSDATADKLAAETLYAYDTAGNLLTTTVRRNVNAISSPASSTDVFSTTTNFYDRLNRLTTVIDANGDATQYRYDNAGQRIQVTDASWNTSRWQYDGQGNVIAETDANGSSTVFEYDLLGNVTAVTDRRGFRTNYVRDNFDRITNEQWLRSDSTGTAFITEFRNKFDYNGRPSVAEQWNMATTSPTLVSISSRIYDDLDRLLILNNSSTPGQNYSKFTYTYDAFGNLTSRDQQTGGGTSLITVTTSYSGYDSLNRLTQLSQKASGPFANWQDRSVRLGYRDDGSTQSITRYSDATWTNIVVNTAFELDASGRLISQVHSRPSGTGTTTISSYQYKYLADGKLMNEVSAVPSLNFNNIVNNFGYDATGQLTSANRGQGADESFAYDSTGNRITGNSIVGKGNRIQNDGNFIYTYDAEGNITRRQRVITAQGADTLQEYTCYTWDHRDHLTKVEFYSAAGVLLKRVEHTYDSDDKRISKKVTTFGTSTTITTENYVYDGTQLVATLNASGTIQHQYFDGTSLDQIFADQSSVNGILWPLEDRTGTARDIINTAGTVLDHRVLDSFGTVSSQSGSTVKYEQFFSGLLWDADSQLYYARARWYEPVSGRFMSEDPLGFDAGDNNVSRYSANDPINNVDRNGMSWFSHALGEIGDAFEDVGDFFEDQWDNGNIQKGLLAAGTLASGGMLGFGLASGSLLGTEVLAGGLGFASGLGSSYEVFSGNRIGDGSFTRYLGAAAAVTGGFYAAGVRSFGTMGRTLSGASGLISGYEIASGDMIGDGTLSSLFHVSNLGVNHGGTMFSPTSTNAQRFGVGLNLAVGTASVITTGDRSLQQSLRALSIASGVWNTGSSLLAARQSFIATTRSVNAAEQPRRVSIQRSSVLSSKRTQSSHQNSSGRIRQIGYSDDDSVAPNAGVSHAMAWSDSEDNPFELKSELSFDADDPAVHLLFNTGDFGFVQDFMQFDPAIAEMPMTLAEKQWLWRYQAELPLARHNLHQAQNDWWWNQDAVMINTASQRVLFLEARIEEMNDTSINYVDIHSGDESVLLAGTYGFANGLKTGAKANVNGISSAAANTFTLGYVDSVEPWTVYEDDINGGYGTALMFARGGGELLLIAAPTGVASLAAHGGRMGKAAVYTGYGLRGVDAVSNWHDAGEASVDIVRNGASLQNTAQLGMSTLGMTFDVYDGMQILDKAGYKVTISGASMGLPLQIAKKVSANASAGLPQLKGRSEHEIREILSQAGFTQSKVSKSAARNETWRHPDGSEVRIHPYGNSVQAPYRSANNAHVHRQDPQGNQLDDRGIPSLNPAATHIGMPNPSDLPQVRGRQHGAGTQ